MHPRGVQRLSRLLFLLCASGLLPSIGVAQQPPHEDKHIFGIVPNYHTMPTRDEHVPPLTTAEKFHLFIRDTVDPGSFVLAGMYAGIGQATGQYASWGYGIQGFGKRYGAAVADVAIANLFAEAVFPIAMHQDPRYFRLGRGSFLHRAGYAVSREVIIRSDTGKDQFNYSEIGGNSVAVAISTAYYPAESRTAADAAQKFAFQIGADAFFNVMKEFWPDIKSRLFRPGAPDRASFR